MSHLLPGTKIPQNPRTVTTVYNLPPSIILGFYNSNMPPRSLLLLTVALLPCLRAAPTAADLARLLSQVALDPGECYRVTDLNFSKDDIRIYLTSGYLSFAKPVNGTRIAAVFTTDVDAGDAEVLLIPPYRGERLSLANFTESPNLDEHFKAGAMIFTDDTAAELQAVLASRLARKNTEMGALIAENWTPALRNLTQSFQVRLIGDLLSAKTSPGIFYMAVTGSKLGNFDVVFDPESREQIVVGQLAYRENRSYFDVWTSFPGKKARKDPATSSRSPLAMDNYRIDATIQPDLSVTATTIATLTAGAKTGRALPFWISRQMRILEAKVDGQPVEVFQRDSLRATLIRGSDNEEFLVVLPAPLDPAKQHEIEFKHEGAVISKAGEHVFFVNARGNWYPRLGLGFARYDLTFRHPSNLVLVSTGDPVAERTEGEWHISQFRTPSPIRFAGFNLGQYDCVSRERSEFKVNVCANREIEAALKRATQQVLPAPNPNPQAVRRLRVPDLASPPVPVPPPNPAARLAALAQDVSGALELMTGQFGRPPLNRLTVSPIPGGFGQGFPGLIYLSTLSYLDPAQRPPGVRTSYTQTFFSDVLDAHEVAHQWWGNLVTSAGYEDDWLMEALADYSALMFLEKKNGQRALDAVLETYKNHLLQKGDTGRTVESYGPITWGIRLLSSHSPESWRCITYEKGAWIIHMLRRRLGDERFVSMLREMCEKYRFRPITTGQFQELAQKFVPPKSPDPDLKIFFDYWVYGTGIPTVKLTHAARGNKITGTLTATDATDDFSGFVPVEVAQGRQKNLHWLHASSDGSPFSITLHQPAATARISLATTDSLVIRR
jgi:hypothetical protein